MQRKKAKRTVVPKLAWFSALVAVCVALIGQPEADLPTLMRLSTVRVLAFSGLAAAGSGSGVFLRGSDGGLYVVTAAHVLPDSCDLRATLEPQLLNERVLLPTVETELILLDRGRDVALLRVNAEQAFMVLEYRTAKLSRRAASPGDVVHHSGFYHGLRIARGVVQGRVMATNAYVFQEPLTIRLDAINMLAFRGCSGGGLFNAAGELVGTMTGSNECGLALTVPVWRLREAIRVAGLTVKF